MSEEEKKLLLIDLCARLPYGVKCRIDYDNEEDTDLGIERYCDDRIVSVCVETEEIGLYEASEYFYPGDIKPYLRPMSSMTEEEMKTFHYPYYFDWIDIDRKTLCSNCECSPCLGFDEIEDITSWLNANHFDYRGLIPMGLALEAPEGMYKTNK